MEIKKNESLKPLSWWQTGGLAEYFCQPKNEKELQETLIWARENNQKISILGGGTNVLISDEGIEGLTISTVKLSQLSSQDEDKYFKIVSEAGVLKSEVMVLFLKRKLAPALFLSGLPGNVGGGVVMNAGVSQEGDPFEFSQIVEWVEVMTGEGLKRYDKEDVAWSYRNTEGWEFGVIFRVGFKWPLEEEEGLQKKIKEAFKKRKATQPLSQPSCGSVFKNPYPERAGALIEKSGLKGLKQGSAMISEKHGNFIVNLGEATSKDIHSLIQIARREVKNNFNIHLETEIHYLGRWEEVLN